MKLWNKIFIGAAISAAALAASVTGAQAKDGAGNIVIRVDPGHGGNDGGRTDLQLIKCHLFFSPNDFDVLMVTFPPRPVNTAADERPFII